MSFNVTRAATRFMRMMIMADGEPGYGFRLSVSPGGCSGLNADISVAAEPSPEEAVVDANGVSLFLSAESRILLEGVTIDFEDTPAKTGLSFFDPKGTSCSTASAPVSIN